MLNLHKVRRGQVFSFTLTELILLILFILLLLLWFITDKKNEELNKWSKVTGTETPEEYEMLYPNFPDKTTTPDVIDRLKAANKELALLKDEKTCLLTIKEAMDKPDFVRVENFQIFSFKCFEWDNHHYLGEST